MSLLTMLSLSSVMFVQASTGAGPVTAKQPAQQAETLVQSAIAAQQHGDLKVAIEDYRKALALRPDLMEARVGLSGALVGAGQFDQAIDEDKRALAAAPDNLALGTNLGLAYYRKGDLGRARSQFEEVHRSHPNDVNAAVLLGYTYIRMNRDADAADLLAPVEAGHEANLDLEYVLGYALIQTGREADGTPKMERVAKARRSADAWFIAGTARFARGEFHEASEDAEQALQCDPKLPGARTLAGQAHYAIGQREMAGLDFQAALRSDPRDFTANLYLGILRLDERNLDDARPLLELAVALEPRMPLARFELAKLNAIAGNEPAALQALEELVKTDPDWLEPHVELATLYYKLHRAEDGQREREVVQRLQAMPKKAESPK
jgi:tetratricopeptide (TPR) repeat protein